MEEKRVELEEAKTGRGLHGRIYSQWLQGLRRCCPLAMANKSTPPLTPNSDAGSGNGSWAVGDLRHGLKLSALVPAALRSQRAATMQQIAAYFTTRAPAASRSLIASISNCGSSQRDVGYAYLRHCVPEAADACWKGMPVVSGPVAVCSRL